ncbi:hypothetical protein Snoj_19140 [Streptomyces nojiriensis]|uniref:Uncharacterized protein n=1 Tax=Streptomyces nojiriensis TaxID=66374 RepID=A0ABQ3SIN7_9ACTN|nr:hypothetical protein GCM10010205_62910 [Streptomyces nojiriensis]GHI67996.1 hypothetical protein Snoj_19140 [Streptomyces nojiriensis]
MAPVVDVHPSIGSAAAEGVPVAKATLVPKVSSAADSSDTSLCFPVRRSGCSAVPTTAPRVGRADQCVAQGFPYTRSAERRTLGAAQDAGRGRSLRTTP